MAAFEAENAQQTSEPWMKNVRCRYFVHGICKNGDNCKYSHELSTPPNLICRYYQNGQCIYGDRCRYDHVKIDKQRKHLAEKEAVQDLYNKESKPIESASHEVDWVNAAEFVPGKQYLPRTSNTYCAVLQEGLAPIAVANDGSPSMPLTVDDICPYGVNGTCANGDNCPFSHGLLCDMCGRYVLHPTDVAQQEKHKEECLQHHEDNMKESFKIAASEELSCGICMEVVWKKSDVSKRKFGILENCNHVFCLECIRKWRSAKAFKNKIVKACPECRVSSSFVTPSDTWIEDEEEKKKLIEGYKSHLSMKPCRYFNEGKGECPFGANCFYKHEYPDGSLQDRTNIRRRRVQGSRGFSTLDQNSLWDFIQERDESSGITMSSVMDYFQDDLDLFDIVYLLGDDSLYSSDDDLDDLSISGEASETDYFFW